MVAEFEQNNQIVRYDDRLKQIMIIHLTTTGMMIIVFFFNETREHQSVDKIFSLHFSNINLFYTIPLKLECLN